MFRAACRITAEFTMPLVVSTRRHDGAVECALGACIILNEEGWLLTAAHLLAEAQRHGQQRAPVSSGVEVGQPLAPAGGEQQRTSRARPGGPGRDVSAFSYWLGADGWSVPAWELLAEADIAVGKVEGFDPAQVGAYPVFQSGELDPGRSLCRLGFPFYAVNASFDEARGRFTLAPGTLPIPRFPSEGIMTRVALGAEVGVPPIQVKFVETSSPGLRGQSGGPIFDPDGHVWGLQVSTRHLALGFDPELEVGGRRVIEHQFLNVGMGAASETVLAFLGRLRIDVQTSVD